MAFCSVLALLIAMQWLLTNQIVAQDQVTVDSSAWDVPGEAVTSYAHPTIDHFAEILDRPVFFKERELPREVVVEAAAPPPTPIRLKLEGVAIATDSRVAVLRSLANNQLLQLSQGMAYNGWKLESVEADSVTFQRGEQTSQLFLELATGYSSRR